MATRSIVPLKDKEGSLGKAGKAWGGAYIDVINADQVIATTLMGTDGSEFVTKTAVEDLVENTVTTDLKNVNSAISKALANTFTINTSMNNALVNAINSSELVNNMGNTYVSLSKVVSKGDKNTPIYFDEYGVAQPVEGIQFSNSGTSGGTSFSEETLIGSKENTTGTTFEIPWIVCDDDGKIKRYGIKTHTVSLLWENTENGLTPSENGAKITTTEQEYNINSNVIGETENTEGLVVQIPWIKVSADGLVIESGTRTHTIPNNWAGDANNIQPT